MRTDDHNTDKVFTIEYRPTIHELILSTFEHIKVYLAVITYFTVVPFFFMMTCDRLGATWTYERIIFWTYLTGVPLLSFGSALYEEERSGDFANTSAHRLVWITIIRTIVFSITIHYVALTCVMVNLCTWIAMFTHVLIQIYNACYRLVKKIAKLCIWVLVGVVTWFTENLLSILASTPGFVALSVGLPFLAVYLEFWPASIKDELLQNIALGFLVLFCGIIASIILLLARIVKFKCNTEESAMDEVIDDAVHDVLGRMTDYPWCAQLFDRITMKLSPYGTDYIPRGISQK